jgi:hypothetical protein
MSNESCYEVAEEKCPACGKEMLPTDEYGSRGCGCLSLAIVLGGNIEKS